MDHLRRDVRHTLRSWRRRPASVIAAMLAVALGIAANTTVFSFVSGILLKPLPYPSPGGLVMIWQDMSARGGPARDLTSPGLFVEWTRRAGDVFSDLGAIRGWQATLTGGDEPERLTGAAVSAGYFRALGVVPAYGRIFTDEDDQPGAPAAVLLSHGLWTRRLGADAGIVGRTIAIDNQPAIVVGVMPAGFRAPVIDAEIWAPARIDASNAPFGMIVLRALGRVRGEATVAQAQSAMTAVSQQLRSLDPELADLAVRVVPLQDDIVGPVRPALVVLWGAVSVVLLIAVANVASLLLARATDRAREVTVRVALGADRRRLMAQMLTESACLATAGGLGGALISVWGVRALVAMAPAASPRLADVTLDGRVLAFTMILTAITAIGAGLAPGLIVSRAKLAASLKEGGRDQTAQTWPRAALVVVEVAAALVLVVGAALLVRSFMALQRVDLGFRTDGILTASVAPPRGSYGGEDAQRALFADLIAAAARLPGVTSASMTSVLPLTGMQINLSFDIDGRPRTGRPGDEPVAGVRSVGARFFDTMGMRLVEGRGFGPDDRADAPVVAVINESLARRYWPAARPLGATLQLNGTPVTIVGVVGDVRHRGPAIPPEAEMFLSFEQFTTRSGWLVLATNGDPARLAPALRDAVRSLDAALPLSLVRPLSQLAEGSVAQARFLSSLLSGFSIAAAGLALVGVYGLIAYTVARRTRELGLRMALGASRASVIRLVLRQTAMAVGLGLLLGAALAYAASRSLGTLLFGVAPGDPATLALMSGLIAMAALLASLLPARRAAGIDPCIALREDT